MFVDFEVEAKLFFSTFIFTRSISRMCHAGILKIMVRFLWTVKMQRMLSCCRTLEVSLSTFLLPFLWLK